MSQVERAAYTITEFCLRNNISGPLYYKLKQIGHGPREMRLGGTVRISVEAEGAWRGARENPTKAEAVAIQKRAAILREHAQVAGSLGGRKTATRKRRAKKG